MRILFIDRSTKLQSIRDLDTRARGGMVSSLIILSEALSRMGHTVSVFSDIEIGGFSDAGVWWYGEDGITDPHGYREWDFLVCNRGIGDGYPLVSTRHRILWTHDLPHRGFIDEPKNMRAFSATVFMSDYAEKIWRYFYRTIGNGFVIPNGVDRDLFRPGEKNLDYIIYASAPNRGLKRLPLILDSLKIAVRDGIYLKAFSNMASMHPNEVASTDNGNGDGFEIDYKTVQESNVELHDPMPQKQFAIELGQAGLMILPTDYPEICSNSILQSLASGTPIITTGNLGSAGEWIQHGKNGMLTRWQPVDFVVYQIEIVRNAVKVLSDEKLHKKMIQKAQNTKILTWDEVAKKWDRMLRRLF